MIMSASVAFISCAPSGGDDVEPDSSGQEDSGAKDKEDGMFDLSAWQYNSKDDVFYQIGLPYCTKPADAGIETLAVFVPGPYMAGTKNEDGTYTCEIRETVKIKGYTPLTAPIVMPVDTPEYKQQDALTEYIKVTRFTKKGFIYVHAGMRGRDAGAPAGVTDLKAAVRYLRYNGENIPGDEESIFTFGMGGGGAQSAIMGASGDSILYDPYLTEIGAISGVSDAVLGSASWCPVTNLETANEAYEWMMGSTRTELSEEEKNLSDMLAAEFAVCLDEAQLRDPDGELLSLDESEEGIFQAGSYYDYMKSVVQKSLNRFLKDTQFPYKVKETTAGGLKLTGTYKTPADYIDKLNSDGKWIKYNAKKNTAKILDLAGFVKVFKPATKGIGAIDQLDCTQTENLLFGYGDGKGSHFDPYLTEMLNQLNSRYAGDYVADFSKTDKFGNSIDVRVDMYTPLYYLLKSKGGYGSSKVARFWRIRSGIEQTDCALSSEVDLALALKNNENAEIVDFATVWGQGHVEAERTGDSIDNFIKWVNKCIKQ